MEVKKIELDKIEVNEANPNEMDEKEFENLKKEIKKRGFLVPIIVRKLGENKYKLIDGEHRFKAVRELGYKEIPAIVLEISEEEEKYLLINLNKIRGSFNPIKYARLVEDLVNKYTLEKVKEAIYLSEREIQSLFLIKKVDYTISEVIEKVKEKANELKLKGEVKDIFGNTNNLNIEYNENGLKVELNGKQIPIENISKLSISYTKDKFIIDMAVMSKSEEKPS